MVRHISPVTPTWEEADKGSFDPTRVEGLPDVHKRTESVCLPAETKGIDEAVNQSGSAPPETTLSVH